MGSGLFGGRGGGKGPEWIVKGLWDFSWRLGGGKSLSTCTYGRRPAWFIGIHGQSDGQHHNKARRPLRITTNGIYNAPLSIHPISRLSQTTGKAKMNTPHPLRAQPTSPPPPPKPPQPLSPPPSQPNSPSAPQAAALSA